ncbi:MAG: hypothetical protein BWX79_01908 [Alphaproteobacteria bacterium ADurb.Bin100]|jgi:hypothetical protein|nr:MAG: hypothetical protein BWX79_01908 [Alphaproteobacteria bacterium ADurb.Bin100]
MVSGMRASSVAANREDRMLPLASRVEATRGAVSSRDTNPFGVFSITMR